jgi:hypothetical protein
MKNHNAFVAGVPDCWYSGNLADLWVEYKYKPVKTLTARVVPALTPQQLRWISCRQGEGRNVWVIMGIKTGGVIFKSIADITFGIEAADFMSFLKTRKELAAEINSLCFQGEDHHERTLISTIN